MDRKQTECAIAAMSRLAEVYDGAKTRLSANDIAKSRGRTQPMATRAGPDRQLAQPQRAIRMSRAAGLPW